MQLYIQKQIDAITRGQNWLLWSTLVLTALALFFGFPSYGDIEPKVWSALFEKAADPFSNGTHGAGTHDAKLSFRLLVPLIVNALHLSIAGVMLLFGIVGVLNFYLTTSIAYQILQNRQLAFIVGLCTAFIYFGKCSFIEIRGTIFDGMALCFILCAMASRQGLLAALFILLGAWCDERALIASSLVWLYVVVQHKNDGVSKQLFNGKAICIYLAWATYFIIRYYLSSYYGLRTDTAGVGLSVLLNQINNIPLGTWSALEGLWIPVVFAGAVLYINKHYRELLAYIGLAAIILLAGLSVVDITRSVVYLFPIIFVALYIINTYKNTETLKRLLWFALLLCFAYPAYYTGGKSSIWWTYPLPLQLIRFI